ncbi:hypothetical protein INR49_021778 [Caranx melampygus]|nr:hypothetical protein INR49_021778 [Caranx melampygus]
METRGSVRCRAIFLGTRKLPAEQTSSIFSKSSFHNLQRGKMRWRRAFDRAPECAAAKPHNLKCNGVTFGVGRSGPHKAGAGTKGTDCYKAFLRPAAAAERDVLSIFTELQEKIKIVSSLQLKVSIAIDNISQHRLQIQTGGLPLRTDCESKLFSVYALIEIHISN